MPGAQENFGTLKKDENGELQVTDEARTKYIKIWKELAAQGSETSQPLNFIPELENREKFGDWHKKWIDGPYKDMLIALNLEPQFLLPVFDPTGVAAKLGMEVPDLDMLTIVGSFAMPPVATPAMLNIGPTDIPSFLPKLLGLVVPSPLPVPNVKFPEIPSIYVGPLELPGALNFPSNWSFRFTTMTNLPTMFSGLLGDLVDLGFWASFTPFKLVDLTTKAVSAVFPKPQTSNPSTFNVNVATLSKMSGEAVAPAITSVMVGGAGLNQQMGKQLEYISGSQATTPTDTKALLNNLTRVKDQPGLKVYFKHREISYADQYTVDLLAAVTAHMQSDTSYRKSPNETPITLEVGNITGWDRTNNWSDTHGGSSFDFAYPMRDESGNWMSGMNLDHPVTKELSLGEKGETPYKCVNGSAEDPWRLSNGALAHDFPALYEIARYIFWDWQTKLVEEDRIASWPPKGSLTPPLKTILIGRKIYKKFLDWVGVNKKSLKQPDYNNFNRKYRNSATYMFQPYGQGSPNEFEPDPADPTKRRRVGFGESGHEDHLHFTIVRTSTILSGESGYDANKIIYKVAGGTTDHIKKTTEANYFRWQVVEKDDPLNKGAKIKCRY